MEAPRKRFTRLLTSLEQLVAQEAATLAERNFGALNQIQQRAQPVVDALAALGPEAADELLRARVAGLLARRQHSIEFLESQLATAREELMAVQEVSLRVGRVAPVYGRANRRAAPATPRFSAAG